MKRIIGIFLCLTLMTATVFAFGYKYRNITTATTTTVTTHKGRLVGISVNKAVASSVITVYDNTAGSGTKIATITQPGTLLASNAQFNFNVGVDIGITVVTSSTDDITIIYE